MNDALTTEGFEALEEIARGLKSRKVSPCVAKHSKHLYGLKFIAYGRNGQLTITDAGRDALFLKDCIDALRAITTNPLAKLRSDVVAFLGKKGHITPNTQSGGFDITEKGRESLADIEATDSE